MIPTIPFVDGEFNKSTFSPPTPYPCCVQVARKGGTVAVRDSKDASKTTLHFTKAEWKAFIAGVKNDEFDV